MNQTEIRAELLPRAITGAQYFTLCFGSIVGVAWMVVFGPIISAAGPGSAVVALLFCGLVTSLVGSCYAEMVPLRPAAGGEMVYAHELLGTGAIPAEWLAIGGWTGLGVLVWFGTRKTRETIDEAERWRLLNLRHEEEQMRAGEARGAPPHRDDGAPITS